MGLFGFGDDPAKEAAKEARADEERRQAELKSGVQQINEIFYGGPIYEDRPVAAPARPMAGLAGRFGGGRARDTLMGRFGQAGMPGMPGGMGRPGGFGKRMGSWGDAYGGGRGAFGRDQMSRMMGLGGGPRTERVQVGSRGGFGDEFYGGIEKAYQDYYMPQLEEQYGSAKTDLKSILSGQRILSSSAGQRRFSDLMKDYEEGRQQIAGRGKAQAQQARGRMEDIRSDLIGQLEGGMGIGSVTDIARAKAASLGAQPAYEPLADMFQTGTGVLASAAAAERAGRQGMGGYASKVLSPFRGGSARVY